MATYLERYHSGEHKQVWAELLACGAAVRTEPLLSDATQVAEETMRRVRHNIELLVPRLESIGYEFGVYGEENPIEDYSSPFLPPPMDMAEQVRHVEELTGPMPLSFRAWCEVVGSVNFGGWHSDWTIAYHDPLWVDPLVLAYVQWEYDAWQESYNQGRREGSRPFILPFAPDYYHKQDVSGGAPYGIAMPNAAADGLVENEWHGTTFVDYLRTCFRWGGFPGFEMVREEEDLCPLAHVAFLTRDLLPI